MFTFFFLTTRGLPLSSKVKSPLRSLLVNALKSFPRDYEPLSIFKSSSLIFCIFSFNSLSFFFFSSLAIKCFLQFSSHAVIGTLAGRLSFTYLGGEGFLSFADLRRLADDPSWLISEVVIYRFRPFLDPIETYSGSITIEVANFFPGEEPKMFLLNVPLFFKLAGEDSYLDIFARTEPSPAVSYMLFLYLIFMPPATVYGNRAASGSSSLYHSCNSSSPASLGGLCI